MLEHINQQLFMYINAPDQVTQIDRYFAIFMANDTLYLLCLCLILCWFLGSYSTKSIVIKAILCCSLALCLGYFISLVLPHERPFVLHLGNTLISHAATASFPSNHMTIFSSIAISFIYSKLFKWGYFLLMLACGVAWARIYVGVHFPLDMLGALILAFITNIVFNFIWPYIQNIVMSTLIKVYYALFSSWINKGIIR